MCGSVGNGWCGRVDRQVAYFENWKLFAIHEKKLLADRRLYIVIRHLPLRDAAESDRAVGMTPGERRDRRYDDLAHFHPTERLRRPNDGWRPEHVTEPLRRQHLDGCDVLEGKPRVLAGCEELEARSNARIGVGYRFERSAVNRS